MAQPRDAKPPSWQSLYQAVLAETDKNKLIALLTDVEEAMARRSRELLRGEACNEERKAMREAAKNLLAIKNERFGWPAIKLW
jgi:hypothetical protein